MSRYNLDNILYPCTGRVCDTCGRVDTCRNGTPEEPYLNSKDALSARHVNALIYSDRPWCYKCHVCMNFSLVPYSARK